MTPERRTALAMLADDLQQVAAKHGRGYYQPREDAATILRGATAITELLREIEEPTA